MLYMWWMMNESLIREGEKKGQGVVGLLIWRCLGTLPNKASDRQQQVHLCATNM
jgi:hypothetical protein